MFELIRANKRRSVAPDRRLRRDPRRSSALPSASLIGLRPRRHDHRPRHLRRRSRSPRTGRPTRSPSRSAAPSRPTRSSTSGCTTSSRDCASPAGCPSRASTSSTTRRRTRSPPGATRKHAAIAVTTGLLEKMNRVELEGVLAHELSHIRNYDILVSTLAVTLVGAIALLTDIGDPADVVERRSRAPRRRSRRRRQPAGAHRLRAADLRPDPRARLMQADDQPPARDARRRQRLPDDPLSAGADLRAREAARRHHRHPLGVHRHRAHVDRAADVRRR